jgi:hypothetical protein
MKDIEILKALIATTANHMGTSFSNACLALLDKIIETKEQKILPVFNEEEPKTK